MKTRGAVLILALWVVALLSVLCYSLVVCARLSIREDKWQNSEIEAKNLLVSLGAFCVQQLKQDGDQEYDAYSKPWGRPFVTDSATFLSQFPGVDPAAYDFTLYARPVDESGKININLAPESLIRAVLTNAGVGTQSNEVARSIIDWRDTNNVGQGEADAYADSNPPYTPPNSDFQRIEELLFVKGVGPDLYFGEDDNFNAILDDNEDDGSANWPPDNQDGILNPGLDELFTVMGDGAININTASPIVLLSALQTILDDPQKSETITSSILSHRRGQDGLDGTEDDNPYKNETELTTFLATLLGEDNATGALALAEPFSVRTDSIRFYLRVDLPTAHLMRQAWFLVSRKDGDFQLLEYHG